MKKFLFLWTVVSLIVLSALSFVTYARGSSGDSSEESDNIVDAPALPEEENEIITGTLGACTWTKKGTVLTIRGNGDMGMVSSDSLPWGKDITEVTIDEGVTSISPCAFYQCKSLFSVTLPHSLSVIDHAAFSGCESLQAITLPDGLISIGSGAFRECGDLKSIVIPKNVSSIGIDAFVDCYSLLNISVDNENPTFDSIAGVLYNEDHTILYRYPQNKLDRSYTIPDSVKTIEVHAFEGSWNLITIEIPDTVTKIGTQAFYRTTPYFNNENMVNGCIYIGNHLIGVTDAIDQTVTVRPGTKTIADSVFVSAQALAHVILPDGLVSIGEQAFIWCDNLKSISLPSSVTHIYASAFTDCTKLRTVYYRGSQTEWQTLRISDYNTAFTKATRYFDACYQGEEHTVSSPTPTVPSTCTEEGIGEGTCKICQGTVSVPIPAHGHHYGELKTVTEPTYEAEGVAKRVCKHCGDVQNETIPILVKPPKSGSEILLYILIALTVVVVATFIVIAVVSLRQTHD